MYNAGTKVDPDAFVSDMLNAMESYNQDSALYLTLRGQPGSISDFLSLFEISFSFTDTVSLTSDLMSKTNYVFVYHIFICRRLAEDLEDICAKVIDPESIWKISVIRRSLGTFMDQLDGARNDESYWGKTINIHFIGEASIEAGGLKREFFSTLFRNTPCFEDTIFFVSDHLDRKVYELIGKAVAYSLLMDDPGLRCFTSMVAKYLLSEKEPTTSTLSNTDIKNATVTAVLKEVNHYL